MVDHGRFQGYLEHRKNSRTRFTRLTSSFTTALAEDANFEVEVTNDEHYDYYSH